MTAHNFIDRTGQTFSRLTVISRAKNANSGLTRWHCVCECNTKTIAYANDLKRGHTKSCGCLNKEVRATNPITHGLSKIPEYKIWCAMKARCLNKTDKRYHDYGGRGITVCGHWLHNFENFYADMGPRTKGLSLDRIDNDGNYEPTNCRWATYAEQSINKRVYKNSPYGISGITQVPNGSWRSFIRVNGKQIYLYYGPSFSEACRLRLKAEAKYWS